MSNTSHEAAELLKRGANEFHTVDNKEFSQVKDDLEEGADLIRQAVNTARDDGVEGDRFDDLVKVFEVARKISKGERSLTDAQDVQDIAEYGLLWMLEEPEECPGYGGEVEANKYGLKA